MYQTILVPLDGSRLAERALPYAIHLARAARGQLLLLRVVSEAAMAHRTQSDLERRARQVRQEGITVDAIVGCGDAAQVIAGTATGEGADLIAMSTHGQSGLGRWLYGSVPDGVLRRATVPVLLIPATCEHPWPPRGPRRILVPHDGSAAAHEAIGPAAQFGRLFGAEVRLLRVIEPPAHADPAAPGENLAAQLAAARGSMAAAAETLQAQDIEVSVRADVGPAARTIASYAQEEGTDLVVMATHGQTGLAQVLMGSVATGIVERANRPLLLVRPSAVRAAAPASAEVTAQGFSPRGPTVDVSLSLEDLDLLERGLQRLLGEVHPAEPVAGLCARLRMAEAACGAATREQARTGH
jgi:nucleotide-binding universal stress UspA family protein